MATRRGAGSLAGLALAVGFLSLPMASGPHAKGSDVSMAGTFRDFGGDTSTPPDRIQSDGAGTYIDGIDHVKAVLDSRGDFDLDMNTAGGPAIRRLFLDFGAPASTTATSPFASGLADSYLSTGAGGLPNITVGSATRSKLQVSFTTAGTQYFVRFDPAQYPDTSNVLITRTAADTWEIEAAPTDIAKLFSAPTRGKLVLTDRGNYFMPFKVVARKK